MMSQLYVLMTDNAEGHLVPVGVQLGRSLP